MATNLSIDPDLLERALEVSGERTKKAAVTKALEEFIARRQPKRLLEVIGKLEWDEGFDYKAERSRDRACVFAISGLGLSPAHAPKHFSRRPSSTL